VTGPTARGKDNNKNDEKKAKLDSQKLAKANSAQPSLPVPLLSPHPYSTNSSQASLSDLFFSFNYPGTSFNYTNTSFNTPASFSLQQSS
jgi:hypothetical protein